MSINLSVEQSQNVTVEVLDTPSIEVNVDGHVVVEVELSHVPIVGEYVPLNQKGQPNGVATLDHEGKILESQMPISKEDIQKMLDEQISVKLANNYW